MSIQMARTSISILLPSPIPPCSRSSCVSVGNGVVGDSVPALETGAGDTMDDVDGIDVLGIISS